MLVFRMDAGNNDLMRVLQDVIVPLVEADRGEIFLVSREGNRLAVHLSGRLAGSPGNGLFCRKILEPAIRSIVPDVEVVLSTGWQVPDGAIRLRKSCESET
jgi:hypothetical protein